VKVQSRPQILAIFTGALQMSKAGLALFMAEPKNWISDILPLDEDDRIKGSKEILLKGRHGGGPLSVRK